MNMLSNLMPLEELRILYWFIGGFVFIYLPGMYLWLRKRKRMSESYEMEHPDAVRIFFGRTKTNDLLTVFSVNGEPPVMHSKGISYGCYLCSGKNMIEAQYQWTTISITTISGYRTHYVDPVTLDVEAGTGKEYTLFYDHEEECYVFARRDGHPP